MNAWQDAQTPFVLATLVATEGSGPRRTGAVLAIRPGTDGACFAGGVSSGCVESDVVERAADLLSRGAVEEFVYGDDGAVPWAPGLTCGGSIRVRLEPYFAFSPDPVMREIAQVWHQFIAEDEPGALLSAGARHLLMMSDGSVLGERADWPAEALGRALDGVREGEEGGVALGEGPEAVFIRFQVPRPRLVVSGGVEIAVILASLLEPLGDRLVVVDSRASYLVTERFRAGNVTRLKAPPGEALKSLCLGPRDAFVALAHDEKIDDPAVAEALRSDCGFVGAMGSRRSQAARLERLRTMGLNEKALARLCGPVGLWPSGRNAREIALSILAQWYDRRLGGS